MKKTHLFLVLAAVVLTGAYNLLQNPVLNNEAQIAGTTRPQFVPVPQGQMSITAPDPFTGGIYAKIPFYGTFQVGQAFASPSPIVPAVFKDGILFTDYDTTKMSVKLGYADGATTTTPGKKQLYRATISIPNQTKSGKPLPDGKYAIGVSRINWTYTSNGQKVLSGTPTGNTIGWRTAAVFFSGIAQPIAPSVIIKTNIATPATSTVAATGGANDNEADKVPLLTFDISAKNDSITIEDLATFIYPEYPTAGKTAVINTLYLYSGNTEIDATIDGQFADIFFVIPKDTTKTFTVKGDIRNASSTPATFIVSISEKGTKILDNKGNIVSYTGSAIGNPITIRTAAPEFTLISKSITKGTVGATSTAIATFNVRVNAVGDDITFTGLPKDIFNFSTLLNGSTTNATIFTDVNYPIPNTGVIRNSDTSWTLQEGNSVILNINYVFSSLISGVYAGRFEKINWYSSGQKNSSVLGGSSWTTSGVLLP